MCLPVKTTWLAVLFFFVGCASSRQRSGSPIDPALLMLAPSDTSSLVWVKMEKLVKTPGFDYLAKSGMIQDALDPIASQTSFDPRKDFWEMLFVSNGRDILMLARGQFAAMGMEPEFKKQGSLRTAYRGQTFISSGGPVLTFMSPSSIAVGGRQALERLVDERAERRGGPPPALMARVENIDRKNQVWWVLSSPAALLPSQIPSASGGFSNILANLPRLLNGVRMITGSLDLSGGINLTATAEFEDSALARQSGDALGALLALARATAPKARTQQLGFYDSVKIDRNDRALRISLDAPLSMLMQSFP